MGDNTVVVKRMLHAPLEKVWNAWTDVEALKQWKSPEGMTTPDATSDLREGGAYAITMQGPTPDNPKQIMKVVVRGVYREVDPMKKLVFTWKWEGNPQGEETVVTVEFRKVSDKETEVILTHDLFISEESRQEHAKGWVSTLNKLEQYLTK